MNEPFTASCRGRRAVMGRPVTASGRHRMALGREKGGLTTLARHGKEHFDKMAALVKNRYRPTQQFTSIHTGLRLDQVTALDAVAASAGVTRAHILRDAVDFWL